MNSWHSWGRFLFGTPQRALVTITVLMILTLTGALTYLIRAIEAEVIVPLLVIAVLLLILRLALGGSHRGERK